jgi:hypothetical protein
MSGIDIPLPLREIVTEDILLNADRDMSIRDLSLSAPVNIYNLDHDSFSGFVAGEHIDHSAVNLTAGFALNGGGNITTSREFNVSKIALEILG